MPRFTREQARGVPRDGGARPARRRVRLLFVGINPGLWTAATQTHFAQPANRFYPALLRAGIITRAVDPSAGMTDEDRDHLRSRGIGITNLVRRATARADELADDELREGGRRLETVERAAASGRRGRRYTAYRAAFAMRGAVPGHQPAGLAGAELWVVPNPSGLNAHETMDARGGVRRGRPRSRGPHGHLRLGGRQPTRCGAADSTARSNGSPSIVTVPPTSRQEPPSTRYVADQVVSTRVVTSCGVVVQVGDVLTHRHALLPRPPRPLGREGGAVAGHPLEPRRARSPGPPDARAVRSCV